MPNTTAAAPVAHLIDEFNKLPGIGPKSAQRLAYFILRVPDDEAEALAQAILDVKRLIVLCSTCQNLTDIDPCSICRNESRDRTTICVVEEPLNILAIERTRSFKGLYHVLHGVMSPMDGIGPDDLKVRQLETRLNAHAVIEVILATNPTLEGDNTAMYLERLIAPLGVRVTRLARGLPIGADLEFADEMTLTRAFEGRREA
ncbi:MAG: recombination mediator RecR [Dehalococcoidia bacterium]